MAAPVALAFNINANLNALRASMADAQGQIQTTVSAMQRMANSLDGSSLIANGNAMVKVVTDLGGASMLTDTEAAKVNATLTETLAKYEALGQTAPPGMRELADATKQVHDETESIGSQLGELGAMIGVAFSVESVIEFGKQLMDTGEQIANVSERTGMTTTEVQQLAYAAGQSGNTLDQLTQALGQMQQRIVSGNPQATDAMNRLGLSFDDLKSLDAAQQLELVSQKIAGIPNPANQARLAFELFGKSGMAILPTLKSNIEDVGNAAPVMSEQTVVALQKSEQEFKKFQATMQVWAAESYNSLSGFFDRAVATVYKDVASLLTSLATLYGYLAKIPGSETAFPGLSTDIKGLTADAQWLNDAAGQMTSHLNDVGKAATGVVPPMENWNTKLDAAQKAAAAYQKQLQALADTFTGKAMAAEVTKLTQALTLAGGESNLSADGFDVLGKKVTTLFNEGAKLSPALLQIGLDFGNGLLPAVKDNAVEIEKLGTKISGLTMPAMVAMDAASLSLTNKLKDGATAAVDLGTKTTDGFKEAAKGIDDYWKSVDAMSKMDAQALSSLGREFAQFGASAGGALGTVIALVGKMTNDIGAAEKSFNDMSTAFSKGNTFAGITDMVSGILAIGSAAITAGKALWNNLFGTQGRDAVTAFAATFGGFDQLHAKLDAVGAAGEQMWIKLTQQTGRNDLVGAEQTIAQINTLLGDQTSYLQRLPAEMQQYGLTWTQAGAAAEQSHLDSIGANLVQSFADLTKAGFDVSTVTKAMSGDLNAYVDEAITTGSEVPEALKPLLQKMIDMGTLTDAAGNQITDLSTSGITFSETLTEGFQSVVDAINQMTQALTGSGPNSLSSAFNAVGNIVVHPKIQPTYDGSGIPSDWSGGGSGNPQYGGPQAAGGDYYVTKPTTFLAGEAGPEHVSFSGANDSRASATRTLQPVIFQIGQRQLLQAVIDVTHASKAA